MKILLTFFFLSYFSIAGYCQELPTYNTIGYFLTKEDFLNGKIIKRKAMIGGGSSFVRFKKEEGQEKNIFYPNEIYGYVGETHTPYIANAADKQFYRMALTGEIY